MIPRPESGAFSLWVFIDKTFPQCQWPKQPLKQTSCLFSRGRTDVHLLCSRTLQGSGATLPLSPWMIAFTLSVGMTADRGWVQLSVWTTQLMKMESGTLSPQWMYAEALQELQPSEVPILYREMMLVLTHSYSSSGFFCILGQGGLRLWRFTGTWALNEAVQFT